MKRKRPDECLWLTADQAHDAIINGDGDGIKVAIIDSGIDFDHPDLSGARIENNQAVFASGSEFESREVELYSDPHGHGTAIASILYQIAPKVRIGSFRVYEGDQAVGRGKAIRAGISASLDLGYHVLNCSFGIPGNSPRKYLSQLDEDRSRTRAEERLSFFAENKKWVDDAFLAGQHIVAACNNEDHQATEWPAHFTSAIAVDGIHCEEDELFRCKGDFAEFAAKGVDVKVAWTKGERCRVSGSSYATPRVVGWIARILSIYPHVDPVQMKSILRLLAYERPNLRLQAGRNLSRAASFPRRRE